MPDAIAACLCYLGTEDGLVIARLGERLEVIDEALGGEAIRAISVHPEDPTRALVGCGLRGRGLARVSIDAEEEGATTRAVGFEDRWVWGLARDPTDSDRLYVGTEPPMVHRSTDGGRSFRPCSSLEDLESREEWTFFHDPFRAGHVHGFAIHPDRPERIYAGVEHGALLYSPDGGETWHDTAVGIDAHRLAVDPRDPVRVLAGTGGGLRESTDGGETWTLQSALANRYVHAVQFDPTDPDRVYVYTADDGDPIHASEDGGRTWTSIAEGLPAARPADTLRLHPADASRLLYAADVEEGGRVYVGTDRGQSWEALERSVGKPWRLAVAPLPS